MMVQSIDFEFVDVAKNTRSGLALPLPTVVDHCCMVTRRASERLDYNYRRLESFLFTTCLLTFFAAPIPTALCFLLIQ